MTTRQITRPAVAVVGAGWTGAACARVLSDAGVAVEVFEAAPVVGGHSRAEVWDGVVHEPNGAHIFHTSDAEVAEFVQRFGMGRPFRHVVVTQTYLHPDDDHPVLLSWPPQIDELRALPLWPQVEAELAALPAHPVGSNFEEHVVSMMGRTLYEIFVEGYTRKQWGRHPGLLSAAIAPRRVELRRDGNRRLFRDRWEFLETTGVAPVIENVLATSAVTCGAPMSVDDLDALAGRMTAVVVTAPLDVFVHRPDALAWRGIDMRSERLPTTDDGTLTPAYVVNHPSLRVDHTRTVETKHATGQRIGATVVGEEHASDVGRHYPVPTVDRRYERLNDELKNEIRARAPLPVHFCGRLADYVYIDQDQAVRRGMDTARAVLAAL